MMLDSHYVWVSDQRVRLGGESVIALSFPGGPNILVELSFIDLI